LLLRQWRDGGYDRDDQDGRKEALQ
jgi:hypothetical protein